MFNSDKKKLGTGPIATLIGAEATITGDLVFRGGLRIDGVVKGNVNAEDGQPSMLVLSENARIEGSVRASHLVLNGTVLGPVQGDDLIELQAKARITGDVRYKSLEIQQGAVVEGQLAHLDANRPGLKLAASND